MVLTQANRNIKVTTPLGADKLLLVGFSAEESLSDLFHFDLDLLSENHAVDFEQLVGQGVTVQLRTSVGPRFFHGIVRSFQQQESDLELASYRAEVVPWLWLLTRTQDCRIFQEKSVPDIVTKIFKDLSFSDFEWRLEQSYGPRTYCVQYRESDYHFVCRLLEEEGIHFFFVHEDGRHVLVLGDAPSANRPLPGKEEIRFHREPRGVQQEDVVLSFVRSRQLQPAKTRLTDYNFETPGADLAAQRAAEKGDARWEIYDYPGEYENAEQAGRYARVRLEEQSSGLELLTGASLCRHFVPGFRMQLKGHPRDDWNAAYLISGLSTRATELGGYRPGQSGGTDFSYQNQFRALPHGKYHRPPRVTPRPIVQGPQTAVVVGPAGEEIYTDKYGRVKVQFHWDREGKRDDKSSCWLRVSQNWAGKNWGAFFLPRIGQEVIVDFLEGDPDRPIVTGRVYHAESMPPLDLPGQKTKSTIKTRSTKGGSPANFNEIRFEDAKGSEELYIHAEKDHNQITENDRTEDVGHDRSLKVGNDKAEEVGNDKQVLVKHDLGEEVQNNETLKVAVDRKRDVGQNETIAIGKNRELAVGADEKTAIGANQTLTVSANREVTVSGDQTFAISGSSTLDVGSDFKVTVTGDETTAVTGDQKVSAKSIVLEALTDIELKVGPATIKLETSGQITIQGIKLALTGAGNVELNGAVVQVKGGLITLN